MSEEKPLPPRVRKIIEDSADRMAAQMAKPVICVGWPTIALLAHGKDVELENAILIPDSLLFNTASGISRKEPGGWSAASCSARSGDLFQFREGGELITKRAQTVGEHGIWYDSGSAVGVSYIRVGWPRIIRWFRCSHPGCGFPDGKACPGCGMIVPREDCPGNTP